MTACARCKRLDGEKSPVSENGGAVQEGAVEAGAVERRRHRDVPAALLGILVLLAGIGLLIFVFYLAYQLYTMTPEQLVDPGAEKLDARVLAQSTIHALLRIILLFVMAVAGSMLAGKGMQLYYASRLPHE
jgi:hypothetical protein